MADLLTIMVLPQLRRFPQFGASSASTRQPASKSLHTSTRRRLRSTVSGLLLALVLSASCGRAPLPPASSAPTGLPPVFIIDTYGLRAVTEQAVRAALRISEGQAAPDGAAKKEAEARVAAVPGVRAAVLASVCCDHGGTILYVGIEEEGTPVWTFRPTPTGAVDGSVRADGSIGRRRSRLRGTPER